MTTTPESWEQQLHDAARTIPDTETIDDIGDTEGQPDGITNDSSDLPDPARAAERVIEFVREFGDGIVMDSDDCDGVPPLYVRDLVALADEAIRRKVAEDAAIRASEELGEARAEVKRQKESADRWCRVAMNTARKSRADRAALLWDLLKRQTRLLMTERLACVESADERDEARAEVERLRSAALEVRKYWRDWQQWRRNAVQDLSSHLHDAIERLADATEPAPPRVPQLGDRVFGWSEPFGTVHGFVVVDEHINADGRIAVKAPAVSTPYAVDPDTVEVIEPAQAEGKPSEWTPAVGERVTGRLDGTEVQVTGKYAGPGAARWLSLLDTGRPTFVHVPTSTLRPAGTGKETDR